MIFARNEMLAVVVIDKTPGSKMLTFIYVLMIKGKLKIQTALLRLATKPTSLN
jgi:hypothetical protein